MGSGCEGNKQGNGVGSEGRGPILEEAVTSKEVPLRFQPED
jgi:hypothetical protein